MDFENRVVVITGAASGIGRALARAWFAAGARLALVDQDADGLRTPVAFSCRILWPGPAPGS